MINTYDLAIADVIRHDKLGLVSHQPNLKEHISDTVRVRDIYGWYSLVHVSNCDWPTDTEILWFWKEVQRIREESECRNTLRVIELEE